MCQRAFGTGQTAAHLSGLDRYVSECQKPAGFASVQAGGETDGGGLFMWFSTHTLRAGRFQAGHFELKEGRFQLESDRPST